VSSKKVGDRIGHMADRTCAKCGRPIAPADELFTAVLAGNVVCPHCRGARMPVPGARLGRCLAEHRNVSVFEAVREPGTPCRISIARSIEPILRSSLEQEARVAATRPHPAFLRLLGYGVSGEWLWWAEEPTGPPLASLLGQPLDAAWSARAMADFALGAALLEPVRGAHLEPSMVYLDASQALRASFFDATRHVSTHRSQWARVGDATTGSLAYMAPELIEDAASARPATTVYALGAILHHMLSGERPFSARSNMDFFMKIVGEPPPRIERSSVPGALRDAVVRCLAKKPEERFASPKELAAALREI